MYSCTVPVFWVAKTVSLGPAPFGFAGRFSVPCSAVLTTL